MNKYLKISLATAGAYLGLKQLKKLDPYNRIIIGQGLAIGGLLAPVSPFIPLGIGIGGLLNGLDIKKGGFIVANNGNKTIHVIHENEGIKTIQPGEIPNFPIDGLTMQKVFGVYKVIDGAYITINQDNSISVQNGFGNLVSKMRGGGFKDGKWVALQKDLRWHFLIEKSL